jgi:anhydro-N-acetylmuramic acid kinase
MAQFSGLYIGLMSGTSCDGIDAALVNLSGDSIELVEYYFYPFNSDLRQQIIAIANGINDDLDSICTLDVVLAKHFSQAVKNLLIKSNKKPSEIIAIGSHGQTIRHEPDKKHPYTTQVADANIISHATKITTIADFRRKDLATGGQGAPLVPAFHAQIFKQQSPLAIVNIGGMSNITLLASTPCFSTEGFDTGPGNVLLDYWVNKSIQANYDNDGAFARSGLLCQELLKLFLCEPFFQKTPPKSTGRELFNKTWLNNKLSQLTADISDADVQTTLVELTAKTILNEIFKHAPNTQEVIVCGGGAKNSFLLERLQANSAVTVVTSNSKGFDSDWIEAMAFAWLAKQTLKNLPGNVLAVTGAKEAVVLGAIYPA